MRLIIGRSRAGMTSALRAATLGMVCVVCGLLAGYQAYKSGQKNTTITSKDISFGEQPARRPPNRHSACQAAVQVSAAKQHFSHQHAHCRAHWLRQMAGLPDGWPLLELLEVLPMIRHHDSTPSSIQTADPQHCNALPDSMPRSDDIEQQRRGGSVAMQTTMSSVWRGIQEVTSR